MFLTLTLTLHDTISTTNTVTHLCMYMDTLYAHYSCSPKNLRLLQTASEVLSVELRKTGKVFHIHWLTSSYSMIDSVMKLISALVYQLQKTSTDTMSTTKDRAKAFSALNVLSQTPNYEIYCVGEPSRITRSFDQRFGRHISGTRLKSPEFMDRDPATYINLGLDPTRVSVHCSNWGSLSFKPKSSVHFRV